MEQGAVLHVFWIFLHKTIFNEIFINLFNRRFLIEIFNVYFLNAYLIDSSFNSFHIFFFIHLIIYFRFINLFNRNFWYFLHLFNRRF